MKKQLILTLVIVAFNANLYSQDGPFRFDGAEDVLIGNSRHWDAKQDVNSNLIWNTWSNRYFTMNGATFRQDGSVGIGTTTPNAKLDVHGASSIRGGGGLLQLFGNKSGTATHAYISFNNLVGSQTAVLGFTDPTANHMYVWNKKGNIGFINGPSGSHSVNLQIMSNGRVGIGTTSPDAKLDVHGASKIRGGGGLLQLFGNKSGTATHAYISFNNLVGSQTAVLGFTDPAANHMYVWNKKGNIGFINGPSGSHSVNLQIMSNGRVGIGTTSPDAKLAVNGDIHAEEVRVDLTVPGPDYVFEEDYDLPTLESIESYTQQNKHLPGVPSAQEMEENGIDLGVMDMLLLKKVEELTLYLIEQNELIGDLKYQNEQLEKRVKLLERKPVHENE